MNQEPENLIAELLSNHADAIVVGIVVGLTVSAIQLAVQWLSRRCQAAEQRKFVVLKLKNFESAMSSAQDITATESGEVLRSVSGDEQRRAIYKYYIEELGTIITQRTHALPYRESFALLAAYRQGTRSTSYWKNIRLKACRNTRKYYFPNSENLIGLNFDHGSGCWLAPSSVWSSVAFVERLAH